MATRTLESEKDRILTILITPFMSCSAKLPVYIALAGTFFGARAGSVIFAVYLLGIVLSMIMGRIFRSTLLKGADAPFVMELPPYRVPTLRSLLIHMWDRSKIFLRKMGGIILIGSIVIWALSSFPTDIRYSRPYDKEIARLEDSYAQRIRSADHLTRQQLEFLRNKAVGHLKRMKEAEQTEKSILGHIGKAMAPVFAPLGIDWRGGVALASGFVAKEIVVSTLGVLYAVDEERDSEALRQALKNSGMSPLSALSMMIFVLLYLPCLATVAAIRRETGSWRWMVFSIAYSTGIAWLMAFCVYQGGKFLGLA
jgi:ferrous iron transport protein B